MKAIFNSACSELLQIFASERAIRFVEQQDRLRLRDQCRAPAQHALFAPENAPESDPDSRGQECYELEHTPRPAGRARPWSEFLQTSKAKPSSVARSVLRFSCAGTAPAFMEHHAGPGLPADAAPMSLPSDVEAAFAFSNRPRIFSSVKMPTGRYRRERRRRRPPKRNAVQRGTPPYYLMMWRRMR